MNDVELAIAVADAGAAVVRRRFGMALERLEKGAGDFATNADLEAEDAMRALLHRERSEDRIVGEERGDSGAGAGSRAWWIDPLCGTLNYAVRMRVVAVNVALQIEARCSAAAVAEPFNDEIFWTDGTSAFGRSGGLDTPLVPSGRSALVDLNCDPPFPNAPAFQAAMLLADSAFVARFKPRVVSSSIALAWVATGQRAAYIADGDFRQSVHFAAGIALCEAAGCAVTDLWGRAWGGGATGLVVAADAETHAADAVDEVRLLLVPQIQFGEGQVDTEDACERNRYGCVTGAPAIEGTVSRLGEPIDCCGPFSRDRPRPVPPGR